MIDGIRVLVKGDELVALLLKQVQALTARAARHEKSFSNDNVVDIKDEEEQFFRTHIADPAERIKARRALMKSDIDAAKKLSFVAAHIDKTETFSLTTGEAYALSSDIPEQIHVCY